MILLHMMIVVTMVIVIVECPVCMKLSTDRDTFKRVTSITLVNKMIEGSVLISLRISKNIFYKSWILLCNKYSTEITQER